jgi:hypothetical protein
VFKVIQLFVETVVQIPNKSAEVDDAVGTLEWQEKQKTGDTGPRLTRCIPCQIFVGPEEVDM